MRRLLPVVLGLGTACSSVEVANTRYYRLGPVDTPVAARPGTRVIRVDDFTVAPHLAGDRLVAALGTHRIAPYRNDVWAAPLDQLVTDAVLRGLLRSNRFGAVLANQDRGRADVSLSGRVLNFEETGSAERWAGLARIAFVLRDERTGRLLWQGALAEEVPSGSDEPEYAVWALNAALGKLLTRLAAIAERNGDAGAARVAPGK